MFKRTLVTTHKLEKPFDVSGLGNLSHLIDSRAELVFSEDGKSLDLYKVERDNLNKWEKAYDRLHRATHNLYKPELVLIEELVNKATPKPLDEFGCNEYGDEKAGYCPNCNYEQDDGNEWAYCRECGQALDWDVENNVITERW